MAELPDFIRRAVEAQGAVDPEVVAASAPNSIPSDEAEAAWQGGDWRAELDAAPPVSAPEPEQLALAEAAKDDAVERASAGTDAEWRALAWDLLCGVIDLGGEFTSDDLWERIPVKPREPRALGPLLLQAANSGMIRKTGEHRPSRIPERNSRPVAVWRPMPR